MPELPEVEVLVRHLAPIICNRKIQKVTVRRSKVLGSTNVENLVRSLEGAKISNLTRRGKFLLFSLKSPRSAQPVQLVGHLGMTGRMYLQPKDKAFAKHAAVILGLDRGNFVFEDTRYFGRFTLDTAAVERLGPEPLSDDFTVTHFAAALKRSAQPVKVRLLDQRMVAGIGNIYASEALFRAHISPRIPSRDLKKIQIERLWRSIRETLAAAIAWGSTIPLNYSGSSKSDGLFYFGSANGAQHYGERLQVYGRSGASCFRCGGVVKTFIQGARSTFYCPHCQRR
jgi:formamidopyrimidine-DNA glycosylase